MENNESIEILNPNYFVKFLSEKNKSNFEKGIYCRQSVIFTIQEILKMIEEKAINLYHEANRPDRDDLSKKQGIMSSLLSNVDLGTISVRVKMEYDYHSMLPDGGHRIRSFLEYYRDEYVLPEDKFIKQNQMQIDVTGLKFSQICKKIPEFKEYFLNYQISFVLHFNMSDEQYTKQSTNMNKSSKLSGSEIRNFFIGNLITQFVRTQSVYNKDTNNIPHKLFQKTNLKNKKSDVLDLNDSEMDYFSICERIVYFCARETAFISCTDNELDDFFIRYGKTSENDLGTYVKKPKIFDEIKNQTIKIMDFVFYVFNEWPSTKKLVKKDMRTTLALIRFLFAIEKNCKEKFYGKITKVDHKKFAKCFHDMMYSLMNSYNTKIYLGQHSPNDKKVRTLSDAFKNYVNSITTESKIQASEQMLLNEFNDRYEEFGLLVEDFRDFSTQIQKERYDMIGEIDECTGIKINFSDVQGDHAIPRSWGVFKGGVTDKHNLRILHKDINQHKKDREFEEYKSSGDWKPILEKILQTKSEKIAA
jgi:hypothetical protein